MGLIDKIKDALNPGEDDEEIYYNMRCEECGLEFVTTDEPSEATCKECGSSDVTEEGRMLAGGREFDAG